MSNVWVLTLHPGEEEESTSGNLTSDKNKVLEGKHNLAAATPNFIWAVCASVKIYHEITVMENIACLCIFYIKRINKCKEITQV